jgi:hypothetical protein
MKSLKNVFQGVKKIQKEKVDNNEGGSLQEEVEHQEKMRLPGPSPELGDLSGPFVAPPMQDSYKENSTPFISSITDNNDNDSDESCKLEMEGTDSDRRRRRRRERKNNSDANKKNDTETTPRRYAASSRRLLTGNNDDDDDGDDDDDVIAPSNKQRKTPTSSRNRNLSSNGSSSRSFVQLSFDSNSSIINGIIDSNSDKPSSSRRSLNSSIISDKQPSSSRRSLNDSSHSSVYSNSSRRDDDDDDQKQLYVIDDFDSDIEDADDDDDDKEEEEKNHGTKVNNIPVLSNNSGENLQAPVVLSSTIATPNIHRNRTRSRDRSRPEREKKVRSVDASSSSRRGNRNDKDRQRRSTRSSNKSGEGEKSSQSETTVANTENRELESEVTQLTTDSTKGKVIKKKISNTETLPEKDGISRNLSRGHRSSRRLMSSSEDRFTKINTSRSRSSSRDLLGTSSSPLPGRRRRSRSSDKRRKRKPGSNIVSVDSQKGMTKLFGGTTQSEEETVVASNIRPKSLPDIKAAISEDQSINNSGKVDKKLHSSSQEFGRAERRARRDKNTEELRKNRSTKRVSDRSQHISSRRSKDRESDKKDQTRSTISRSINHKQKDTPENKMKDSSHDDSVVLRDSQGPVVGEFEKISQPSEPIYESDSQNLSVSSIDQGDSNSKLNKEDIIKDNSKSAVTLLSHLDKKPSSGSQNRTECSVQSSGESTGESQGTDPRKLDVEKRMTDDVKKMKIENNPLQPDSSRSDDANSNGTEFKTADLEKSTTRNKSNIVSETLLNENEASKEYEKEKGKNARIDTTISEKEKRKSSRKSRQKKKKDVVKRDSEIDSSNNKPSIVSQLGECRLSNDKLVGKSASKKSHNGKKKSNMSLNDLLSKSELYAKKEMISDSDSLPPPSLAPDADYPRKNKTIMRSITENDDKIHNDKRLRSSTFVGNDLFALLDKHTPCSKEDICDESLASPSLFGDTNRSKKNGTQIECVIKSADETESEKEVKQQSNVAKTSTAQERSSSSLRSDDSSSSFVLGTVDDGKFPDDNEEPIKKKKRNGMLNKMRMATSTFTESGRTTIKKAGSTRNLFEQKTIKVFARGKEEGKGLLRNDSDA